MSIHHIILLKFKVDTAPADIEKIRATLRSLPERVPSVIKVKVGQKIKHPLDQDFDECVVIVFKDEAALKDHTSSNKTHSEFQASTEPYIQDKLIFDIQFE